MSTRSDNMVIEIKQEAPVDPRTMIFKSGKLIGAYRVFAATHTDAIEIFIGDTRSYTVSSVRYTAEELAKHSMFLYLDVNLLRSLINNLNGELTLQVANGKLAATLQVLKRTVEFITIEEKTDDAQKLAYMRADYDAYKIQMDKIVASYKTQLMAKAARKYEEEDDLSGLLH